MANIKTGEKRTEHINIKILPSVKQMAWECAEADERSLSNWLEKIIRQEHKKLTK